MNRELFSGILVLAAVAVAAWLSTASINGGPLANPYRVQAQLPAGAPSMKDGDEVRIAGQRAGQVRSVEPGEDGGALVTLELDDQRIRADTRVRVRLRGLAGAVYLEVEPGTTGRELESGERLPGTADATDDLTDVIETFDLTTRRALSRSLRGYGRGMAGRGGDLGETLADLGPAAHSLRSVLDAAAASPGELGSLLRDSGRFAQGLDSVGELGGAVKASRDAFGSLAAEASALERTLVDLQALENQTKQTLPVADALLDDLAASAERLEPAVQSLTSALPSTSRLLRGTPGIATLARIGSRAGPVLEAARPAVSELYPAAAAVTPTLLALEPLAGYLSRYRDEIFTAPDGFRRWGGFHFQEGRASGSRAVRFSMVFTCHRARDAYPDPGEAEHQEERCAR